MKHWVFLVFTSSQVDEQDGLHEYCHWCVARRLSRPSKDIESRTGKDPLLPFWGSRHGRALEKDPWWVWVWVWVWGGGVMSLSLLVCSTTKTR